jgi:uncharacterized membrane protein
VQPLIKIDMMWYLPITILPGLGMLILSTTSQMMTISTEVGNLLSTKYTGFQHQIAEMKIKQIQRLTYASTLLYFASGAYVLSGIVGALMSNHTNAAHITLIIGTVALLIALFVLVFYSFKTIRIRKIQFEHNHLKGE